MFFTVIYTYMSDSRTRELVGTDIKFVHDLIYQSGEKNKWK